MKKLFLTAVVAALAFAPAFAQDNIPGAKSFGLTATFGNNNTTTIGGVYNFNDQIALRPWVGFTIKNTDKGDYYTYDTAYTDFELGTDLLYQIKMASNVVLGVGGRVGISSMGTTNKYTTYDTKSVPLTINATALMSAQYFVAPRLGVYIDAGLGMEYYSYKYDNGTTTTSYSYTKFGTSTFGIGLAVYLK